MVSSDKETAIHFKQTIHILISSFLGTPINNIPKVQNYDLDLHRLFKIVRMLGGYNKV